jgi:hypothetical protein
MYPTGGATASSIITPEGAALMCDMSGEREISGSITLSPHVSL